MRGDDDDRAGTGPGPSAPSRPLTPRYRARLRRRARSTGRSSRCRPARSRCGRSTSAAGTGKLTARPARRPRLTVIAVEPDPAMLAELRARLPAGRRARPGTAETIPLPDGSVDAVLVGQAFHWFDPSGPLPEIARVLRPGGVLAALWNRDDADGRMGRRVSPGSGRRATGRGVRDRARVRPHAAAEHPRSARREYGRVPTPVPAPRSTGLVATLATHSWALISDAGPTGDAALARVRATSPRGRRRRARRVRAAAAHRRGAQRRAVGQRAA